MQGFVNTADALRYASDLFNASLSFILDLVEYLPGILGSAVIVFGAVYLLRFLLLK